MFDSLLNSKFYNRCKHAIKCTRTRLDPIRRKKQAMLRFLKKDIADLIANGLDSHAFGRMEGLIFEMNQVSCYDMIEQFCDYIVKELNTLQKQKDCPQEAMEAISTLIFATARFPDLPELCDLRHIFTDRYGNYIESFVSSEFVQNLQNKTFSHEEKVRVMQSIAEEFSVEFDPKALERKLSCTPETKHDLPKKGSFKWVEPALPVLNGKDGAPRERKSEGSVQKQVVQLEPKDIHVIPDGIGRFHEKSRKQHSENPDNMEPLDNFVSPVGMKRRDSHKEVKKDDKRDLYRRALLDEEELDKVESLDNFVSPVEMKRRNSHKEVKKDDRKDPYRRALLEEEELELYGPRMQEVSSVKFSEGEMNNRVRPYTKLTVAEKEGPEKENGKAFGYCHKSRMPSDPDYDGNGRHAEDRGLEATSLEKQANGSVKHLNGKTVNKVPPYTKPNGARTNSFTKVPPYTKLNGARSNKCAEEENDAFLYDRQQQAADLQYSVQNRHPMPEKAVNMRPPYVKPKLNMRSVPANQTVPQYDDAEETNHMRDGLLDDELPRPISVREKYAKLPLSIDARDEVPKDEKIMNQTPGARRKNTSRRNGASGDDCEGTEIGDLVSNGKHIHRTPSGRRGHTGRRHGAMYDDNDEVIHHQEGNEDERDSAIDFGNLLPRTASGQRRHRSRNTEHRNGGHDEEERMMDKLLIHYSKKGSDNTEAKTRTKTRTPPADKAADGNEPAVQVQHGKGRANPPERAVSLPVQSVGPVNESKVPARSTSMQPDEFGSGGGRVHPRMPDFDELAARISALRNA